MTDIMEINPARSQESEIDRLVDQLIRKLATENLSSEEEAVLSNLMAQRSRLMRPAFPRARRFSKHAA